LPLTSKNKTALDYNSVYSPGLSLAGVPVLELSMKRPSLLFLFAIVTLCPVVVAQQFQPAVYYSMMRRAHLWGSVAADFNNDGNLDIAIADNGDSQVAILLGAGDGSFHPVSRFPATEAIGLAAGGLNGDGKVDLVVTNGDGSFINSANYS
jgi:hypothetical protein